MGKILSIGARRQLRQQYIFRNHPCLIRQDGDETVLFPCIGLFEREAKIAISYPGFERWYLDLNRSEQYRTSTLKKIAYTICTFLNYILWNTDCDNIAEITVNHIREFLIFFRTTKHASKRTPEGWERGIHDVFKFLQSYYTYNHLVIPFKYDPDMLLTTTIAMDSQSGRKYVIQTVNKLNVKLPQKKTVKNRVLAEGYLDLILFEAQKYDPMLTLGIALQSYAGLREGEIVNLTRSSIKQIYAGFGRIGKISIDLNSNASFAKWERQTDFGSIKKFREQEVYPDFFQPVLKYLAHHESLLGTLGASHASNAPLFINKHRKPLSVFTYRKRVKDLFEKHFLPDLKLLSIHSNTLAVNKPYIESYEKNYPGAHMFRHWFTMYLIMYTVLTHEEIAKWRGDSSLKSMNAYIHVYGKFFSLFKDSMFRFQRSILEEALARQNIFQS